MRKLFLFVTAILFNLSAISQSQLMLYQLGSSLPQSNLVNPGIFPDYKVSIGLPVLSSSYVSVNAGNLSFNNAFSRTADDSLHFNPQQLADKLDENNRLEVNGDVQLFYLGLNLNKNYISLGMAERVGGGIVYPRTFVQLLAGGNGEYLGQLLAFDKLGLRAQAYHEISLGYGRKVNDKLTVGMHAKFLSGVASFDIDQISAALLTSTDSIYLYSSAFNINSTGLDLIDGSGDIFKSATAFKNKGFAMDFGAQYWINDKIQVSLAVNDLGSMNWTTDTRQIHFNEVKYSFTGIDFIEAIDPNNQTDLLNTELDSLKNLYQPDTIDNIGYKSKLNPKIYAGGTYHLGKNHTFGATFYGDVFKGTFKPAFGLSYNLQLGTIWTIGVNASYRKSSFSNFGVGTSLNLGPIQIYVLSENVTAFTKPGDARFIDARFGMNLIFGKLKKEPKHVTEKSIKTRQTAPVVPAAVAAGTLSEDVTIAFKGDAKNELATGFYIIIASFNTMAEANKYQQELLAEGYAASNGFQSEKNKYYTYLMYFAEDGNKAIDKKNDLQNSFAPGLETPWVLWVKAADQ